MGGAGGHLSISQMPWRHRFQQELKFSLLLALLLPLPCLLNSISACDILTFQIPH